MKTGLIFVNYRYDNLTSRGFVKVWGDLFVRELNI